MINDNLHCPMTYDVYKFQPEQGEFSACCDAKNFRFDQEIWDRLGDQYFTQHPGLIERKQWLYADKKHPHCQACWEKEDLGIQSMRSILGAKHPLAGDRTIPVNEARPTRIELWMNSTCNLGCFMCHNGNSNTLRRIYREDPDVRGYVGTEPETYLHSTGYTASVRQAFTDAMIRFACNSIADTRMSHLTIAYLGGEPTLHDEMYEHVDTFIEAGRPVIGSKRLKINIVTNGTSKPNLTRRILDMYERYRQAGWETGIQVSIDGMDTHAQSRYGADTQQINDNLRSWIGPDTPLNRVIIGTVISNLSMPYIDRIAAYVESLLLDRPITNTSIELYYWALIEPLWMRLTYLPRHYADAAISRNQQILSRLHKHPMMTVPEQVFHNIANALPATVSHDDMLYFMTTAAYVQRIYRKTYPRFSMLEHFPHMAAMAAAYGIDFDHLSGNR